MAWDLGAHEYVATASDLTATASESFTAISDSGSGRLDLLRASASETLTASNAPDPSGQVVDGALTPSITPEAFTAISDAGSGQLLLLLASASETLTASETATGATSLWARPSESFTLISDTGSGRLLLLRASASETLTLSNTPDPVGDAGQGLPAVGSETLTLSDGGRVEWHRPMVLTDTAVGSITTPEALPAVASELFTAVRDVRPPQAEVGAGSGTLEATPDAEAVTLGEAGVVRWQWWIRLTDTAVGAVIDPNSVTVTASESARLWDQVRGAVVLAPGDLATADPDDRVTASQAGQVFWIWALTLTDSAVGQTYNWDSGEESWDQDAGDEYILALRDRTPIGEVGTFGLQITDSAVARLTVLVASGSEDLTLTDPEAVGGFFLTASYNENLYLSNTPAPSGQVVDPTSLSVPDAAESFTLISDTAVPQMSDLFTSWEDTLSLSDTAAGSMDLRGAASETLTLSDTGAAVLPVLEAAASESLTLTDVVVDVANDRREASASETLTLSDAAVGYPFGLPADDRTWVVRAESRVWTVEAQDRRWRVPAEDRGWTVDAEDRVWTVPEDDTDVEV